MNSLPYLSLRPTVHRNTPPNATSSPKMTAGKHKHKQQVRKVHRENIHCKDPCGKCEHEVGGKPRAPPTALLRLGLDSLGKEDWANIYQSSQSRKSHITGKICVGSDSCCPTFRTGKKSNSAIFFI